jgi:hypothetical protein
MRVGVEFPAFVDTSAPSLHRAGRSRIRTIVSYRRPPMTALRERLGEHRAEGALSVIVASLASWSS